MSSNNEAALQRLANALALGDGFQFHILVCHSPLQVRQSLTTLAEAIPALRGGSLITRPLLPDPFSPDKPLDSTLTAAVTEGLSTLPPPAADERVMAVLDASFVAETEIPAWRQLFRRLNEQRNAVADQVDAALLLCLSPTLEPIFAHEAPDFWSIRGVSVRLEAEAQPTLPSSQFIQAAPSAEISLAPLASTADELPALRQAVEALRQRASANPDDLSSQYSLAIQLGRLGDVLRNRSQSVEAIKTYREVQTLLEHLTAVKQDVVYQRNLAVAYERLGDLMASNGQIDEAHQFFIKGLEITLVLAEREPQQSEYQRDLLLACIKLGDVMTTLGNHNEAHQLFSMALDIAQHLARTEPQRTDYQCDLSLAYHRLGDHWSAIGNNTNARQLIRKALEIHQHLAQAEPQRADYQRNLSFSYEKLGDISRALGLNEEAHRNLLKAIDIRKSLARAEPQRTDYLRDLSVAYGKLGDMLIALGNTGEAHHLFRQALDVQQRLAQAEPQRADLQRDLIVSHVKLAENNRAEAASHLEKALALAQRLKASGQTVQGLDWMVGDLADRLARAQRDSGADGANGNLD